MTAFMSELWRVTCEVAPSLFLGLLVAGVLHVFISRDRVFRHLGRPGLWSTVKASLWGVPLPLCSCGVIPAALSLRRDGASPGATTAFLVSTPQTGVDSILVTAGMLGWPVAIVKMAGAFVAGLISGVLTDLKPDPAGKAGPPETGSCGIEPAKSIPARFWGHAFGTIFRDLYRWLALGLVVSALLGTLVPPGRLSEFAWLNGPLGMLAALAIGIPLYVCSTASVPIAASLVAAGFAPGAALVFLMAGPATNAATMGAVRKTLGGRVFVIYLSTIIGVSLAAGLLLNSVIGNGSTGGASCHVPGAGPGLAGMVSGILLTAGILWWTGRDALAWASASRARTSKTAFTLKIDGMSCGSCERRVRNALLAVEGVRAVSVSREDGSALVDAVRGFDPSIALAAVAGLGYGVRHE
jgi:uncharacterized protein